MLLPHVLPAHATRRLTALYVPALAALAYPLALQAFFFFARRARDAPGGVGAGLDHALALACVGLAYAVPLVAFLVARALGRVERPTEEQVLARRLAHLAFVSPPLLVGIGVLLASLGLPLGTPGVWAVLWGGVLARAFLWRASPVPASGARAPLWLRVSHGAVSTLLLAFLALHLANHLVGLWGPEAHGAVMDVLRRGYRQPAVEGLLLGLFGFQGVSGVFLLRPHTLLPKDGFGTLQTVSGAYLGAFLLSHLAAVLLLGRTVLRLDTDWTFATGGPAGLLGAASSVPLIPYYSLAVFLVVAHAATGLRSVLLEHRCAPRTASRVAVGGMVLGALASLAITAAMLGVRSTPP